MATSKGLAAAVRVSTRDWWALGARKILTRLIASGRPFTSEMIVNEVGEPDDPHMVGALIAGAQRSGLIESYGASIGQDGRARRQWVATPTKDETT